MIISVALAPNSSRESRQWPGAPDDLEVRRHFLFEADDMDIVSQCALSTELANLLRDPLLERVVTDQDDIGHRHSIWVGYKRGIVDNESDSLVQLCHLAGVQATGAKIVTQYISRDSMLEDYVRSRQFNRSIQDLYTEEPHFASLALSGHYAPIEKFDLRGLSDEELVRVGRDGGRNLDLQRMKKAQWIQAETGADFTADVLLEALDARWSDHCYHTTWRSLGNLLKRLSVASEETANPNIVSMFHDNAGVWDFYEGQAIAFKAETHNGPSAVSAYFGQLTKLGGVLRDILGTGQGASPIGSFEYTALGVPGTPPPIPGRPTPLLIAEETIRAIKEYGNTFGVPMMWSRMAFRPAYRAKPFALGGSIGVLPKEFAQKGTPQPGDLVLLIGGLTGNDGIHGASGSSAGAEMDHSAVQIGSPLEEVKFHSAILDLRDSDCLRALTDVGGAGLNSAVGEIGDPCGVLLNTARVPLKTAGLPMWRILLSESQERMVLAVKAGEVERAREILTRHDVRHSVIGRFTGNRRYTVIHDPQISEADLLASDPCLDKAEIGFDVPYELLDFIPDPIAPSPKPCVQVQATVWPKMSVQDLAQLMPAMLADIAVQDQSLADSQYDSTVQGRHTYGPYCGSHRPVRTAYWAAEVLEGKPMAALFAASFTPESFEIDSVLALRGCFFDTLTALVAAGSRRQDVAFCDNFYTPHLSADWAYWLEAMVDELAALVRRFGTPVISGKDSSAGSVNTAEGMVHVPPAVFLSAIGKVPSFYRLLRNDWQRSGSQLVRIGLTGRSTAGTVAGRALGLNSNDLDTPDVERFARFMESLEKADRTGWRSAMPIGPGGVLVTAALRSIGSGLGAEILESGPAQLLAEPRGSLLLEIDPEYYDQLPAQFEAQPVGTLSDGGASLKIGGYEILTLEAKSAWTERFGEMLT